MKVKPDKGPPGNRSGAGGGAVHPSRAGRAERPDRGGGGAPDGAADRAPDATPDATPAGAGDGDSNLPQPEPSPAPALGSQPDRDRMTAAAPHPRPSGDGDVKTLIELRDVHKRFGRLVVLNGVSVSIPQGQSLVIIGASGSGKSVILKHMVGLLKPDRGEIWFDGRRIDDLKEKELVPIRQQFGFLFQMGALFDSVNVEENVAFPLVEHTQKPADEIRKIAAEKLAMVGLPDVGKKMPAELSGGQRKRVALARAIALGPRVIVYDEPTTGLDPIRSDVINELILKLKHELHVTSVVVTHDMQSAFKVGDRVVMLHEGKLIFDGTPEQVQQTQDPVVRRFVAGEADERELGRLRK